MPGLESPDSVGNGIRGSFDGLSGERKKYEALKNKYENVVKYTVELTAERDQLKEDCEASRKELERAKRKPTGGGSREPIERTQGNKVQDEVSEKGFSFFILVFSAFLSFVAGRFWKELWFFIMGKSSGRSFEEDDGL